MHAPGLISDEGGPELDATGRLPPTCPRLYGRKFMPDGASPGRPRYRSL